MKHSYRRWFPWVLLVVVPLIMAQVTGELATWKVNSLTGAIARGLVSRFVDLPINPKDYGAVGDGVTDDTAAINNAIKAGTQGDNWTNGIVGRVRLPAAQTNQCYLVTSSILIDTFQGNHSILLEGNNQASCITANFAGYVINGVNNSTAGLITIRNLKITNTHPAGGGIQCYGTDGCYMEHVQVAAYNGIHYEVGTSVSVRDSIVSGPPGNWPPGSVGILGRGNSVISNLDMTSWDAAIRIHGGGHRVDGFRIERNVIGVDLGRAQAIGNCTTSAGTLTLNSLLTNQNTDGTGAFRASATVFQQTASTTGTAAGTTLTVASGTGIVNGNTVWGQGVPAGITVTAGGGTTTLTTSAATTASASPVYFTNSATISSQSSGSAGQPGNYALGSSPGNVTGVLCWALADDNCSSCTVGGGTMEANNIGVNGFDCATCILGPLSIQGDTSSPAGLAQYGVNLQNFGGIITGVSANGSTTSFTGAGINYGGVTATFINTSASSAGAGPAWAYSNSSSASTSAASTYVNSNNPDPAVPFSLRPSTAAFGQIAIFTDSNTAVTGATIAGGGSTRVIGICSSACSTSPVWKVLGTNQ